jgi:hypothetical protein
MTTRIAPCHNREFQVGIAVSPHHDSESDAGIGSEIETRQLRGTSFAAPSAAPMTKAFSAGSFAHWRYSAMIGGNVITATTM